MFDWQLVVVLVGVPAYVLLCAFVHALVGTLTTRRAAQVPGGERPEGQVTSDRATNAVDEIRGLVVLYQRLIPAALIPWVLVPLLMVLAVVRQPLWRSTGIDILAWLEFGDGVIPVATYALLTLLDVVACYSLLVFWRRQFRDTPRLRGLIAITNYFVAGAYICVVVWSTMFVLMAVITLGYG